jgi:hypothetical protein
MLPQFTNSSLASFFLWAENRVTNFGQAYQKYASRLYYQPDSSLGTGFVAYAAPFRQWVCDSGVYGAHIVNEISGNGGQTYDRTSGIHFDYNGGRIIAPTTLLGTNSVVSGSYSFKEINFYLTNEPADRILSQDSKFLNPRYNGKPTGALPAQTISTPAIFISSLKTKNEPFEFGGTDMTNVYMTMTVMTQTPYQMDAVFGILADTQYKYIPIIDTYDDPIDEWGDTKNGAGYNYNNYLAAKGSPGNLMYIKNVDTSRLSDRYRADAVNQSLYVGIIDFQLQYPRTVRPFANEFYSPLVTDTDINLAAYEIILPS